MVFLKLTRVIYCHLVVLAVYSVSAFLSDSFCLDVVVSVPVSGSFWLSLCLVVSLCLSLTLSVCLSVCLHALVSVYERASVCLSSFPHHTLLDLSLAPPFDP